MNTVTVKRLLLASGKLVPVHPVRSASQDLQSFFCREARTGIVIPSPGISAKPNKDARKGKHAF